MSERRPADCVLDACHPGCGWNGEVEADPDGRWTCPHCGQRNVFKSTQDAEDVRRLRVALRHAIEELEGMVPYVPEYFREKWGYDEEIAKLKVEALETGAL